MKSNPNSKFLQQLPQYHFDRKSFCKIFEEVFTLDEICHIHMLCFKGRLFENFFLYYIDNEFYITHLPSGTTINWYKHLGRTNTCNKKGFGINDLKEFLILLKNEMDENGEKPEVVENIDRNSMYDVKMINHYYFDPSLNSKLISPETSKKSVFDTAIDKMHEIMKYY